MRSAEGFPLDLVPVDLGGFFEDVFGDRVRDVAAVGEACVGLDDVKPRVLSSVDEDARELERVGAAGAADEEEVDGDAALDAWREFDEGAVGEEGGVERDERVLVEGGDLSEVRLGVLRVLAEEACEALDAHPAGKR